MARLGRRPVLGDELLIETGFGPILAKLIPGSPGYFAGSDGFVYSARLIGGHRPCRPERQQVTRLRSYPDARGYLSVYLYRGDGTRVCRRLHVVVCIAWYGPRPKRKMVVRHMNGVKADCRPANLQWGTQSANVYDWQRTKWERQQGRESPVEECPF